MMAHPVDAARDARTRLRRGLAALQGPGAPAELQRVAEPIAAAMGELFEIEHGGGATLRQNAAAALAGVRRALGILQAQPMGSAAVEQATEAVASSLGLVHALSQAAAGSAAKGAEQPRHVRAPAVSDPTGRPLRLEVALGAHSPSNFYQGLSGTDVIESGGIFVATYRIPKLGQSVILKVSLPGGYEFEAMGVVRWTRDAQDTDGDSPPGFGAQLTRISPEGRQLAHRYVRNREPLFHEDP